MKKIKLSLIFCSFFVLLSANLFAYSGSVLIFPFPGMSPEKETITRFEYNTLAQNPYTIDTNLYYVKKLTIETMMPGRRGDLTVTEYPNYEKPSFSITVSQTTQNALVKATVYFWAPYTDDLEITHIHEGVPPAILEAHKAEPAEKNEEGDILWYIETSSFSDFYAGETLKPTSSKTPLWVAGGALLALFINIKSFLKD